ncbi:MAG: hypothetical protein H6622_14140 [Halobacteriovoraceae bacterium]|nr:hypothetical protein [Halobacteriovoraceae bacterium]
MKKLITLVFLLSSIQIFSQEESIDSGNFEEMKQKMMTRIDKRIADINEHKACVSAASDIEQLKECRKKNKQKKHHDKGIKKRMGKMGDM